MKHAFDITCGVSLVSLAWRSRGQHSSDALKALMIGYVIYKDLHLRVNRPLTDQMAVVGIWIFHYVEQSKTFRWRMHTEKERCLQSQYRHLSDLAPRECSTIVSQGR